MSQIPKAIPELGLYLYTNAVDEIAENAGLSDTEINRLRLDMAGAIRNGDLRVVKPETGARYTVTPCMDNPSGYVSNEDVNYWLQTQGFPYRWTPRPVTSKPVNALEDAVSETTKPQSATTQVEIENSGVVRKTPRRTDALTAVIDTAKQNAPDANDYHSVWATLVKLAESPERPAPLVGFVEGEGVKYQGDTEIKFFTKEALRKRMNPSAR